MLDNDRRIIYGAVLFLAAIVSAGSIRASADNSYASNNKGYSGTSYARSAKPQNAGQTMYSSNQSSGPPPLGTSYASGGSYAGSSYARSSAGVPSSHINLGKSTNGSLLNQMRSTAQPVQTNFSRLSTGNGAASNRASMLSVMGRGASNSPKPVFVRPASAAGVPVRHSASGKAAAASQSSPASNSSATTSSSAGGGVSVLSQIRKRRGG